LQKLGRNASRECSFMFGVVTRQRVGRMAAR